MALKLSGSVHSLAVPTLSSVVRTAWPHVVGIVLVVGAWTAVSASGVVQPAYLAPSPLDVWEAFVRANTYHEIGGGVDRVVRGEENYFLWEHLVVSLRRIGLSLAIAVVIGVPSVWRWATSGASGAWWVRTSTSSAPSRRWPTSAS